MKNIINLPDWEILATEENGEDYRFTIRYSMPPASCPLCARMLPRLKRFGVRKQLFLDLPIHAKRVGLLVLRQRYQCQECQRAFVESLPDMHETRRATQRLVDYIEKESLKRTFASVANDVGMTEGAIRAIFHAYLPRLEQHMKANMTPRWLGIDEIKVVGHPRGVITNVEKQTLVELLHDRSKKTVIKYLTGLKDRAKIELVAMDMWEPYRDAVHTSLPRAVIVIDKFHVVRMANAALDAVRKSVREGLTPTQRRKLMHDRFILLRRKKDLEPDKKLILDVWLGQFPQLQTAYDLKESFFTIWERAKSSTEAKHRYAAWEKSIPPEVAWAFKDLTTAVQNWNTEIFAYFDHRVTNAYTESLNNLTRLTNRIGRGYSFEAIRAKMLFNGGLHIEPRPRYSLREPARQDYALVTTSEQPGVEARVRNYGVEISTLAQLLEADVK
jgi:transposase